MQDRDNMLRSTIGLGKEGHGRQSIVMEVSTLTPIPYGNLSTSYTNDDGTRHTFAVPIHGCPRDIHSLS